MIGGQGTQIATHQEDRGSTIAPNHQRNNRPPRALLMTISATNHSHDQMSYSDATQSLVPLLPKTAVANQIVPVISSP